MPNLIDVLSESTYYEGNVISSEVCDNPTAVSIKLRGKLRFITTWPEGHLCIKIFGLYREKLVEVQKIDAAIPIFKLLTMDQMPSICNQYLYPIIIKGKLAIMH